jgi:hypothetical protein
MSIPQQPVSAIETIPAIITNNRTFSFMYTHPFATIKEAGTLSQPAY